MIRSSSLITERSRISLERVSSSSVVVVVDITELIRSGG